MSDPIIISLTKNVDDGYEERLYIQLSDGRVRLSASSMSPITNGWINVGYCSFPKQDIRRVIGMLMELEQSK